jgi:hypothetical protein
MAEIKTVLYGITKEKAEQKMTINEQQALITEKKAYITHMHAEDDYVTLQMCFNFGLCPWARMIM